MANITKRRERLVPPHVPLAALRAATGRTLDSVCAAYSEATGENLTRGALSAIENGIRGASTKVLSGLEAAYGLPAGSIDTTYEPRTWAA